MFLDKLRRAANTKDFDERCAHIYPLLSDTDSMRASLVGALGNPDHTPLEKDIAAFILFTFMGKAGRVAVASYYVSRLRDPYYHTGDYLDSYNGHRHGGHICHWKGKGKDQRAIIAQYACPMPEIEKIGRPALKYLVKLLADGDGRTRALAYDLVKRIVGRRALPYDVFTTDNSKLVKLLSEEGWLGEKRVSGARTEADAATPGEGGGREE
ncbi:MAG: hypothetical protein ACYTFI_09340 [Planctomycetota bacterium]